MSGSCAAAYIHYVSLFVKENYLTDTVLSSFLFSVWDTHTSFSGCIPDKGGSSIIIIIIIIGIRIISHLQSATRLGDFGGAGEKVKVKVVFSLDLKKTVSGQLSTM